MIKELDDHHEDEEEMELPGFRFHPTDEELVRFYLRRKVENKPISKEIIKQVDVYKFDPWDLPKSSINFDEKEWYFFCLRGRKYRNSVRPNRVTGSGFWKATGIDKPVYPSGDVAAASRCIGLKKSLVYYRGSAGKGTKTDWMMHEFRLPNCNSKNGKNDIHNVQEAEIWTICKIFKRSINYKKNPQYWKLASGSSSSKQVASDSSSVTTGFDSDSGGCGAGDHEYKLYGTACNSVPQKVNLEASAVHNMNQQAIDFQQNYSLEHFNQLHNENFWNCHASDQAAGSLVFLYPAAASAPAVNSATEYVEGSWDELGRMMEFMMDSNHLYDPR